MWRSQNHFSVKYSVGNHTANSEMILHPRTTVLISRSSVVHPSYTSMGDKSVALSWQLCPVINVLHIKPTKRSESRRCVSFISPERHDWSCVVWHVTEKAEIRMPSPRQTRGTFKEMTKAELLIWNGISCLLARASALVYLASWICLNETNEGEPAPMNKLNGSKWAGVRCYSATADCPHLVIRGNEQLEIRKLGIVKSSPGKYKVGVFLWCFWL